MSEAQPTYVSPAVRASEPQASQRAALEGLQASIWTALPAIVESYDAAKNTCTLQPAIMAQVQRPDGSWQDVVLPLLVDVPVVFCGGGPFVLTYPVAKGDEAVAVFMSRCLDAWWQSGGVQRQAELRMHDLSDAMAFVGPNSVPNVPGGISGSSAQLRLRDGSAYLELTAAGALNVVAPGGINLNGVALDGGGNTDFGSRTVKQGGKHVDSTHFHGDPQGGDTTPVAGP